MATTRFAFTTGRRTLTSAFSRTYTSLFLSTPPPVSLSTNLSLIRLRPLAAVHLHRLTSGRLITVRSFATRQTSSSLNDPNPNWSNRPPKETILLDGCDFEHWLVVMEKPEGEPTRDEIIDSYIKTLATVVGSEEEARMKIYSVSTRHYYAFGALVSEELSYKLKELPRVRWVLPDSYLDVKNKDYGGEPFINGQAVPYDPKYHEEWVRNNARANERNRRNDRPRNFDRSRNFERRREMQMSNQNVQNSNANMAGGPPANMAGGPPGSIGGPNMAGGPPGGSIGGPNMAGGAPGGSIGGPNMAGGPPGGSIGGPNMAGGPPGNMGRPNMAGGAPGSIGGPNMAGPGNIGGPNMTGGPPGSMTGGPSSNMGSPYTGHMPGGPFRGTGAPPNMGGMPPNMVGAQHGGMGAPTNYAGGAPPNSMGGMPPNMGSFSNPPPNFENRNGPSSGGMPYQSGPGPNQNSFAPNAGGSPPRSTGAMLPNIGSFPNPPNFDHRNGPSSGGMHYQSGPVPNQSNFAPNTPSGNPYQNQNLNAPYPSTPGPNQGSYAPNSAGGDPYSTQNSPGRDMPPPPNYQ